ncbi:uncharacterized protein [Miscanthus floridulus]|uniref:uncharacterized protein n=1 Tax=Miscanthus floridulus TaxID=154761 RepID=UPI003458356E
MLDQRWSTILQHQWVSKLFGYDFNVEYRLGHLNTIVNALSRWTDDDAHLSVLTRPSSKLFEELCRELQDKANFRAFLDSVVVERGTPWCIMNGLILRGTHVFVPATSTALPTVLQLAHTAGHEEALHLAGLLQPLEVTSQVWSDIALDFIKGLPRVHGKSVILTVVD